ncbi:hypothetical protein ILUMI_14499, partial [Ignelater luminosus]
MNCLVVHWDGKQLPDLIGKEKVNCLPVIVSYEGSTQLLEIPKLEHGTGRDQAKAIFQGACVLLEQHMERNLLYLPCRRHIVELILKTAFKVKLRLPTFGLDVPIFKKFQEKWPKIDSSKYELGIADT